jgi:hypothetical protein
LGCIKKDRTVFSAFLARGNRNPDIIAVNDYEVYSIMNVRNKNFKLEFAKEIDSVGLIEVF